MRHRARLPDSVVAALAADPDIRAMIGAANPSVVEPPRSWFLASAIHLAGPEEEDLVVIGRPPILGANVTTFWIFRPRRDGFELLLTASAHDISIKNRRFNSYREVDVFSATAVRLVTVRYRLEGATYKAYKTSSAALP